MNPATQASLRTVLLLAGTLLCLMVAVWPLIARGARRRPAPNSRGTYSWRLSAFALLSTAAFVAALWMPPHQAPLLQLKPDVQPPIPLPAAGAIGPGTGIAVTYADGSGGMGCTAGFLVRTDDGDTGVLTAGHCNKVGEQSKVSMNPGSIPYTTVGRFSRTVLEGERGEAHDIGLILLDSDEVPRTPAITASMPVTGVADELQLGQQLCKYGMTTGRMECGQITGVSESKVVFLAASRCGDSGGPVYLLTNDGAVAVGIHIRAGRPNDPNPGCSTPATFSVAELVQPWLTQWGLTAVTS
ncbi:S1 family peptidase [Mycobacterium asiaticum]|nr:S1 family peptidase [Mycobacterium asiaticum]